MKRTTRPDIVYPVRPGDWNEELRYSLRSLRNLPHGRVWIIGHKPPWVKERYGANEGVYFWPRAQRSSKYRNANESLVEITQEAGTALTSPFLLMNDDFYITSPLDQVDVFHMGPVDQVIDWYRTRHHRGVYWRGMVATNEVMKGQGITDALSYELHIPMPIYRDPLLEAWAMGRHLDVLHIRTLYGNIAQLGGTYMEDVKVYGLQPRTHSPFMSTNDRVLQHLRDMFPDPSPYESH